MNFIRKEIKPQRVRLQDLKPGDAFRSIGGKDTYVLIKMGSNINFEKCPELVQRYFALNIEVNEVSWWGNDGTDFVEPIKLTVLEE